MKYNSNTPNENAWTQVWDRDFQFEENKLDIEREAKTVRAKKIKQSILDRFGSFKDLKVIEVGAGRGIYSMILNLEGVQTSLLDNNQIALDKAGQLFGQWGKKFEPVLADIFNIPENLVGQYDVVMSYGFTEHFLYPERYDIYEAHKKLLKPGGLLVISVPNAAFLPYRIGKWVLSKMNKWMLGLEVPYYKSEKKKIAKRLQLKNWKVIGSGVVGDTLNFWLIQRLIHLPAHLFDKLKHKFFKKNKKPAPALKNRFRYYSYDPHTFLDDTFGYALVLIGEKA